MISNLFYIFNVARSSNKFIGPTKNIFRKLFLWAVQQQFWSFTTKVWSVLALTRWTSFLHSRISNWNVAISNPLQIDHFNDRTFKNVSPNFYFVFSFVLLDDRSISVIKKVKCINIEYQKFYILNWLLTILLNICTAHTLELIPSISVTQQGFSTVLLLFL